MARAPRPSRAGPYTPKRGPHAGQTYPSYYQYRNTVVATSQGYSSYAEQQAWRNGPIGKLEGVPPIPAYLAPHSLKDLGVPVSAIVDALPRAGAGDVEYLAMWSRLMVVLGDTEAANFAVDEILLRHPTLDPKKTIFPDSP